MADRARSDGPLLRRNAGRRALLAGLAAAAFPHGVARAQQAGRIYRLGHLATTDEGLAITRRAALPELARLGYDEGRNLVLDARVGTGDALVAAARAMAAAGPDAIIAIGPEALQAAAAATRMIPIVIFGPDPVAMGLAESLARPGGNVTGVMILPPALDAKRLELLHETLPAMRRIALLLHPDAPWRRLSEEEAARLAARLGVALTVHYAAAAGDYDAIFAAMRAAGAEALVIGAHPQFNFDRERLSVLAIAAGLPTVCEWAAMARAGCLIGYGPDQDDMRRRVARTVAAIFGGAAPATLPIETPTRFEFAVNQRTARALGVAMPPSILIQADEVIE
jgi:putative ABC transport system substrate-binding protein